MKLNLRKAALLLSSLLISSLAFGQNIVLPDLLKGDIVLQQQTNARIWGKAKPAATVTVTTSWNGKSYTANAASDSLWAVKVETPEAGYTPYSVTIKSGNEEVALENVLIGDVWFCGGQSNMTMPLQGMIGCYVEGAARDIALAGTNKGLRYVTIGQNKFKESHPEYFTKGIWYKSSPATAASFSAAGYYFGAMLTQALDIPIGLISCNWSGSFVEDWIDSALLEKYPDQKVFGAEFTKAFTQMFYGMLEPTSNYTIKGMIWYQGESNVGSPNYTERLDAAVALWREKFELEEMPFYIVELAPYKYNQGYEDKCPYLREQQFKASKLIPNSGYVSTNDLWYDYETTMIHPCQKKPVGERLAYLALSKAYGFGNPCEGPEYDSVRFEEGAAFVSFNNVANGWKDTGVITGFEIAGADKVFHPATATYARAFRRGGTPGKSPYEIKVVSEEVPEPVAVRYCFRDILIGNVYNTEGLPLIPFRTDDWE